MQDEHTEFVKKKFTSVKLTEEFFGGRDCRGFSNLSYTIHLR